MDPLLGRGIGGSPGHQDGSVCRPRWRWVHLICPTSKGGSGAATGTLLLAKRASEALTAVAHTDSAFARSRRDPEIVRVHVMASLTAGGYGLS